MMDIKDKDTRMALVTRYLEAETTVAEEAQLAAYYTANEVDEVLKNGSKAAEQWGSKGLNGVIIVTTKASKESK